MVYFGSVSQLAGRFLQFSGRKGADQGQLCFHYAEYQTSSHKPLLKSVCMVFSEGALGQMIVTECTDPDKIVATHPSKKTHDGH